MVGSVGSLAKYGVDGSGTSFDLCNTSGSVNIAVVMNCTNVSNVGVFAYLCVQFTVWVGMKMSKLLYSRAVVSYPISISN